MARTQDLVFFDGGCGLCHRAVRFAVARDGDGSRFRFAPLGGETFEEVVPAAVRRGLPDSMVVLTREGKLLARWRAVERLLVQIGGAWGIVGRVARLVPRPLMDAGYGAVAAVRSRVFAPPREACPVCDPALRGRFLA